MAELVTASSQVLERALGESGRLETAGSDVMSGKQIVGRKNGASRTRPTWSLMDCEPPVYRRQRTSVRLFRQRISSEVCRCLRKHHIARCGGGRPQRTERVESPGWWSCIIKILRRPQGKSPTGIKILVRTRILAARAAEPEGKRPTAMCGLGRCNPDWPEQTSGHFRAKVQGWNSRPSDRTAIRESGIDWRPYLKPERARDNKERRSTAGLLIPGNRLQPVWHSDPQPRGCRNRKSSGNGRGRTGWKCRRDA